MRYIQDFCDHAVLFIVSPPNFWRSYLKFYFYLRIYIAVLYWLILTLTSLPIGYLYFKGILRSFHASELQSFLNCIFNFLFRAFLYSLASINGVLSCTLTYNALPLRCFFPSPMITHVRHAISCARRWLIYARFD